MLELSFKLTTKVAMWQENGPKSKTQGEVRKVNHTYSKIKWEAFLEVKGKHDPMTLAYMNPHILRVGIL
jgi:hypothetical protein